MKKALKFLLVATCMVLPAACDKSDQFADDLSGNDLKKASSACPEIVVEPEDGKDTENLVAAFEEAKALGPGTVVRLTEGTYTIGMIEVRDFDGALTGAGQGKTIITNLPDLPCDDVWLLNQLPSLLTFIGGNIVLSELTIHFQDGQPCKWGPVNDGLFGDFGSMLVLADYSKLYIPGNRCIKGFVDHVDFIAGDDGGYGYYQTNGNVAIAIYCGTAIWWPEGFTPLSTGEISVTNCTFKDCLVGPDLFAFDEKSKLKVANNVMVGGFQQIFFGSMSGTSISIKNNSLTKGGMFDVWIEGGDQGYFPELLPWKETKYIIEGNNFQSPPGVISLYLSDNFRLKDPDVVAPHLYEIKGNVFNIGDDGMAILSANIKNAKIWNNQFLGTGSVGVWLDGDEASGTWSEENQLTGNNFLEASYANAAVYLGPVTRNNTVAGVSSEVVVDEGTNNRLIGMKASKQGVPPLRPLFKGLKPPR